MFPIALHAASHPMSYDTWVAGLIVIVVIGLIVIKLASWRESK